MSSVQSGNSTGLIWRNLPDYATGLAGGLSEEIFADGYGILIIFQAVVVLAGRPFHPCHIKSSVLSGSRMGYPAAT